MDTASEGRLNQLDLQAFFYEQLLKYYGFVCENEAVG
jgi:hypothetical protein